MAPVRPAGTRSAREYRYTRFGFDQWFALARWMYQRAWIGNERPTLLFDLATKCLVDKKVVLPGVTVLERLVPGIRERAEKRLWATLAAATATEQAAHLQQLVVVPAGKRLSELDRLRRSPRDISPRWVGMDRNESLRTFGGSADAGRTERSATQGLRSLTSPWFRRRSSQAWWRVKKRLKRLKLPIYDAHTRTPTTS
ncbi:DUF4158 domain-containing protein [Streptomyces sp. NPDC060006]|uniref:DUF4158 domain-containing protein n=1 Tax=unclassified Streptomyces TaxID=2593676 RepID=UPI0036C3608B